MAAAPGPGRDHRVRPAVLGGLAQGLSSASQQYEHTAIINGVRAEVDKWRRLPNPRDWKVTPETERLLCHWRSDQFSGARPFFCQVEAVETAIWLTEVAPQLGKTAQGFLEHLENANRDANPLPSRLALKRTLKAEIDAEAWATLRSDTSRPFPNPSSGRIAVKVINHLGDEAMKVFKVA